MTPRPWLLILVLAAVPAVSRPAHAGSWTFVGLAGRARHLDTVAARRRDFDVWRASLRRLAGSRASARATIAVHIGDAYLDDARAR